MMEQMSLFSASQLPLTVSEVTGHIRQLIDSDELLVDLWVQGEVSNLSQPKSGHLYFTLKDTNASLQCVMWRSQVAAQVYLPQVGDAVEAHGGISVYEAGGRYQLYVDLLRPAGEGLLYQEFLRLKDQLEAEGLFDSARKRPIPPKPQRIGVVTSPTGAALRDVLDTLSRRYPLAEAILSPTSVQGEAAPGEIVAALERLNRLAEPDVILLVRGGGSLEDLWAFNEEMVARAVAASEAPVISGVGHETDFTIADFVADLRAPTPTAAAELATPYHQDDLRAEVLALYRSLAQVMFGVVEDGRWTLDQVERRLERLSPLARVRNDRQRLDEIIRRVGLLLGHRVRLAHADLRGVQNRLLALSPRGVLERGFAIVSHPSGGVVRSTGQVASGDALDVRVSDGHFGVQVTDKE